MKKFLKYLLMVIFIVFFFLSQSFAISLLDFESSSWQNGNKVEVYGDGSIGVGLSSVDAYEGNQDLELTLDLPLDPIAPENGIIDNYVYFTPQSLSWDLDSDELEYFVFYLKSDTSFYISPQFTTSKYIWTSGRSVGGETWKQVVLPLQSTIQTDSEGFIMDFGISGFTIPDWYKTDMGLPKMFNTNINLNDIKNFDFSFYAESDLKGKVFIDDIKVVNDIDFSIPLKHPYKSYYYNENNTLKVYFGPTLQEEDVVNNNILSVSSGSLDGILYKTKSSLLLGNWNIGNNHQNATITVSNNCHFKDSTFSLSKTHSWDVETFDGGDLTISSLGASVTYGESFALYLPSSFYSTSIDLKKTVKNESPVLPEFLSVYENKILNLAPKISLLKKGKLYWGVENLEQILSQHPELAIYQFKNNQWTRLPTKKIGKSDFLMAEIDSLSSYCLLYPNSKIKNSINLLELSVNSSLLTLNDNGVNDSVDFTIMLNEDSLISLEIYDSEGNKIKELATEISMSAGLHKELTWDGTDQNGNKVLPGIYIYHIKATAVGNITKCSELNKVIGVIY